MEGWKDGRMEGWKQRVEGWKGERVEERMEGWKQMVEYRYLSY